MLKFPYFTPHRLFPLSRLVVAKASKVSLYTPVGNVAVCFTPSVTLGHQLVSTKRRDLLPYVTEDSFLGDTTCCPPFVPLLFTYKVVLYGIVNVLA